MDIYAYLEQVQRFLNRQDQQSIEMFHDVPAELVMRFRAATLWPVLIAKQFLSQFPSSQQAQYVELAEIVAIQRSHETFMRDPIEEDPAIRPLFEVAYEMASREVETWHQQYIAELEQESPAVADLLRSQRGLCHRHWARVKELLWEQHGIEWRSPAEMNPWMVFD